MNIRQVRYCAVPLGSSTVDCECTYRCVGTFDCHITVNVDAVVPHDNRSWRTVRCVINGILSDS